PPGFTPAAPTSVPSVAVAPPAASETRPIVPGSQAPAAPAAGDAKPGVRGTAPGPRRAAATGSADSKEYGPVKRGETLAKIAASVKPEAVTLEQMLVNLYRSNPDAFDGNMNRLKTGKILRVPEKEQIADTGQSEAVKEIRVQAANWNAYRQKLAGEAGEAPARESKRAASGKITTAVDDKASGKEAPKEVLKLSKGEPTAGKTAASKGAVRTDAQRMRALEEEATAREKALADANDRIAQLEKTIKDMQRLLEVKGQVPAVPAVKPVPPAAPGAKPETAPQVKTDQVAKADSPKPDAMKMEPAKDAAKIEPAKDMAKMEPAKDAAKMEPGKDAAKMEPAKDAGKAPAVTPTPQADVSAQPKPKPRAAPVVIPPEPSLVDQILGEPLYLAGIGGVLALLGVGGYLAMRRRRTEVEEDEDIREKAAPRLERAPPAVAPSPTPPPTVGGEDVDPIAEADLYLNFGRDAQAEEVLNEALAKNPKNEEAQLKLLQIYAGRKDRAAFERVARNMHTQSKGTGDSWLKAAAMGYAIDSANRLYDAGKSAPVAAMRAAGGAAPGTDLDFDFEALPASSVTATDVELDSTAIMPPGVLAGMADASTVTQDITSDSAVAHAIADSRVIEPDFTLEMPSDTQQRVEPDITLDAPSDAPPMTDVTGDSAAPMANVIDFNFDTVAPAAATPAAAERKGFTHDGTYILNPEHDVASDKTLAGNSTIVMVEPDIKLDAGGDSAAAAPSAAPQMPEFKLDDVNLNLDDTLRIDPSAAAAEPVKGGAKDDHWYDVQTKFDLAKAYQEMGDQDGAREILQEVTKEGDAGQQAEAKKLLDSLS
ncbi:MAG TPA: FimV/HubP family polar landmark protein, partial [Burkholderiales bacterium]|nr:FimV/HubP family polar landmark protein [Burkholderiales bacterium]